MPTSAHLPARATRDVAGGPAARGTRVVIALLSATAVLVACGSATDTPPAPSTSGTPTRAAPLWDVPPDAALPASTAALLQKRLDTWIADGKLHGATAAVVTPRGTWVGAAGVDGAGRRLRPQSALQMASVTKTFTAAELMLLSQRGLVDLDAPVSTYIDLPFDSQGATVRQLLGMRSGFPTFPSGVYPAVVADDLDRDWTPEQVLALLTDSPRKGTLGGTPSYNNLNYVALGELIARVTGRTAAEVVRTDLIEPAGLARTWVQTAEKPTAPLTVGTQPYIANLVSATGPYLPSRAFASFTGSGGQMASDAADLARWGFLLYGGQIIDTALVQQMEADPQPDPDVGPYALGTTVLSDDDGTTMVGHGGGGLESPYSSVLNVWTGDEPVSVAVMAPEPVDFAEQFYYLVIGLQRDTQS